MSIGTECRLESHLSTDRETRQCLVLSVLDRPMTARQVMQRLGYTDLNSVRPRLTELVKLGKVREAGKAYDAVSDRNVTIYEVSR